VKPALIDTDILSMFFRGNRSITRQFETYIAEHQVIQISIVTYYEILSGLRYRGADRQVSLFLSFVDQNLVLPLTQSSTAISANCYATLRQNGNPVDDIDLLIAGVAIANDLVMVTHNQSHFGRIPGLECQDWSQT
jgi:tRNA(fMet)-specific endonuclease VapC